MDALATLLLFVGAVVAIVGAVWFLAVAFEEHVLWGLACLFVPLAGVVFLVLHWRRQWRPLAVALAGKVVALLGIAALTTTAAP